MWYQINDDGSKTKKEPCRDTAKAFGHIVVHYRDLIYTESTGDTRVEVCKLGDDIGEPWYVLEGHAYTPDAAIEHLVMAGFTLKESYQYLDAI